MPRPADVNRIQIVRLDHAVHVGVNEIQARRGAPVAQQARLDVLLAQRFAQQRIFHQIDLADRKIIGSAPVRVDLPEFFRIERARESRVLYHFLDHATPSMCRLWQFGRNRLS